jgi:hypothetical protein
MQRRTKMALNVLLSTEVNYIFKYQSINLSALLLHESESDNALIW